jgi:hypothetical protein
MLRLEMPGLTLGHGETACARDVRGTAGLGWSGTTSLPGAIGR